MAEGGVRISSASNAAEALRATRLALGLKQADVAERAGVAKLTLSNLESGRRNPSVATLASWATAVGAVVRIEFGTDVAMELTAIAADTELRRMTLERLESGDAERIRINNDVTRTALAEKLCCGHVAIASWEAGRSKPKPDSLLLAYGRTLEALQRGEGLGSSRSFGHDMLGVRLDNILRRAGIDRARAHLMTDVELGRLPGLGAQAIRRIREWGGGDENDAPRSSPATCRQVDGTWIHGRPHDCPKWVRG